MSEFSLQVLRARRWIPFAVLLLVFIAAQIAVVFGGTLAPSPRGHWTGHLTNTMIDAAMLVAVLTGVALAWRRLGNAWACCSPLWRSLW